MIRRLVQQLALTERALESPRSSVRRAALKRIHRFRRILQAHSKTPGSRRPRTRD